MEILDPGHKYKLHTLDGKLDQTLTFVKRMDIDPSSNKFPGNTSAYPGTVIQDVLRCLIDRIKYLNNQIPCPENQDILVQLRKSLCLLEERAAKRHNRTLEYDRLGLIENAPFCKICGHLQCKDHN